LFVSPIPFSFGAQCAGFAAALAMAKGCWLLVLALVGVLLAAFFSTPRTLPSPLLQAAYKGELDVVQRMLPLTQGREGGGTAAANHDATFVAHVREQANAKDAWNNTALHVSLHTFAHDALLPCVVVTPLMSSACMSLVLCCVQWAVKGGHVRSVEIAKHLLSAGVDARATNNGGSTALHWAATGPVADISRALIALLLEQPDVYVNAANNAGETPLHWAVDWVRPHAVQALLSAGADVTKVDRDGNSPLHKIKADCDESEESVGMHLWPDRAL
jgi:ankyrin repeat protein